MGGQHGFFSSLDFASSLDCSLLPPRVVFTPFPKPQLQAYYISVCNPLAETESTHLLKIFEVINSRYPRDLFPYAIRAEYGGCLDNLANFGCPEQRSFHHHASLQSYQDYFQILWKEAHDSGAQ